MTLSITNNKIYLKNKKPLKNKKTKGRSMRSNHSTWDPRRPLYEELKPPPVPRRHYHGSDDCYHAHPHPGS